MRSHKIVVLLLLLALGYLSCRKWEDHVGVYNQNLQHNLLQLINSDTGLSQFSSLLIKTGYDKVIASTRTYTVWAPRNAAIQNLDPAVTGDPAKLKQYVGNHIANEAWLTAAATTPLRLQMLNGKYVRITSAQFDSAHITRADQYANNGILQVIDSAAGALPNIWEFVNSTTTIYAQDAFMLTLNYTGFDSTRATLDSINPATGQPVYVPGTGQVNLNHFTDAYAVNNEDSVYTYFIIRDPAFNTGVTAQKPFYVTSSTDSTTRFAGFNVVKDLAVRGQYNYSQLPDSLVLLSKYNVRVPIVKSAITEIHRVSNGVVYVLDHISFPAGDKNPPIVIQGETPTALSSYTTGNAVSYRYVLNPTTNTPFRDLYVFNVGGPFYARYHVNNVYSTRYHVYWVAPNDLQTTTFSQRIAMDSSTTTFPYVVVPLMNYSEIYLGDYTTTTFGGHDIYLINTNSTTSGVNTLDLDYVKLVPF
ncbi:MAG TPA: fasciclin domain-containing protein [Puia sp.]|jgi:uncharacterized surface protein with fasciclin (FAS1) repeats